MLSFCTLLLLIVTTNCLSVPVTTANTTTPVLVGPVKKIKAKATEPSEGRDFLFENTSMTKTETTGGMNHVSYAEVMNGNYKEGCADVAKSISMDFTPMESFQKKISTNCK